MRALRDRKFASWILAASAILSILAFGGAGLDRERGRALLAHDGEKGIRYDLEFRAEAAYNLARVAEGYEAFPSGSAERLYAARERLIDALARGDALAARDANGALEAAYLAAYENVGEYGLSGEDAAFASGQAADFEAVAFTLRKSGYNALAADYNALRGRFPARLIGWATGVGALPVYDGNP